ncbi:MAG: hypothetical protein WCP29_17875 [Acidobacteriota bacterium]
MESTTLKIGGQAPPFTLPNQKGQSRSLSELLSRGPLLLGFHRGTW